MTRRQFFTVGAGPWPAAPRGRLRAGAATANITPLLGCSLAGGMTDRIGTEIHDELRVRALVLDNGHARLALAAVDSCAVPRSILDRAKELAGLPPSHVLISATHTHSAPPAGHLFQSVPDPKYTEWLTLRIADAIKLAVNRLQPARIGWATGREDRLVFNRRYFMKPGTIPPDPFGRTTDQVLMNPPVGSPDIVGPAGAIDPEVGVVAVEAFDGRPIALLGNYALHYVGGTGPGHVSADYFGAWAIAMRRMAGRPLVPILTNGCSGNINGVNFYGPRVQHPPYRQMERYADILAVECARVWRTIVFEDTVELAASIEELEFGVRLPSADDLAQARRTLAAAGPGPYKERSHIYARETVFLAQGYPPAVKTWVQALRIGSLGIATYPGEAFVELGLEVKAKSPFRPTLLVELANDYRGYLPTVEGHEQGGYETWRAKSSYLEKEAATRLAASALRQLRNL
jgi:hypothetical protein